MSDTYCRHCDRRCKYKSPGVPLCWTCERKPELRERHKIPMYGNMHNPAPTCNLKPAKTPTNAIPGSEEKIRVMQQRAERGEQIFHDLDLTCLDDGV